VVVAVGLTETAVPLVAVRLPGVITPVPPVKTPVRFVLMPDGIEAELAPKLVIEGAATACTEAAAVTDAVPPEPVTVSVYAVVTPLGGVTLTAVPLVTARLPGVTTPVPFEKTPVSLTVPPLVTAAALEVKLEIEGGVEPPPVLLVPPHPEIKRKPRLKKAPVTAAIIL
jgi:hypothetical protein